MQEQKNSTNTFSHYQILCKRLNPAKMMCVNPLCQNPAPCCVKDDCQSCREIHPQCKILRSQIFIQGIAKKRQPLTQEILEGIKAMQKAYDDAIDRLSKDKQFITSQMDMFGFNQHEVQFMRLIQDGLADQITGKLNDQIIKSTAIKKDWVATYDTIQRYWNRKSKIFNQIFDKFKNVMTIGIPKFESKITDQVDLIMEFLGDDLHIEKIQLLYRASQQGFQVANFHNKCDGKSHTLVLARTQFGRIIGGYSHLAWNQSHNYGNDYERKSFLFSITNKEKYPNTQAQYANYGGNNYGPTFGGGHDFYIANNSNTQNGSYFNFPHSYNNGKYVSGQQSYLAFSGATNSYNARVEEWEVFQLHII